MVQTSFGVPVPTSAIVVLGIILAILAIIMLLLIVPIYFTKIDVSARGISVRAPPLYFFSVKREDVMDVFVVRLSERSELKPSWRTFGTGLPGYYLGWFKLRNGAKAFCAVSGDSVVVFKLRSGEYLIVSPDRFSEFVSTLETLGWSIR